MCDVINCHLGLDVGVDISEMIATVKQSYLKNAVSSNPTLYCACMCVLQSQLYAWSACCVEGIEWCSLALLLCPCLLNRGSYESMEH